MSTILRRTGTKLGIFKERSASPSPVAGSAQIYAKLFSGNTNFFVMDSVGNEYALLVGSVVTAVKIANYSANVGETVRVNPTAGGFTITLPAISAGNAGGKITIKNQSNSINSVIIDATGADTIDSVGSFTMNSARETLSLQNDGISDWMIV